MTQPVPERQAVPERWTQRAAGAPHNYDLTPELPLAAGERILDGGELLADVARLASERAGTRAPVVALDCYPGVELDELSDAIGAALPGWTIVDVESAARPIEQIDALLAPQPHRRPRVRRDDALHARRVLRHRAARGSAGECRRRIDPDHRARAGEPRSRRPTPTCSCSPTSRAGRSSAAARRRSRTGAATTATRTGCASTSAAFFVEWRVADRHKRQLFDSARLRARHESRRSRTASAITGEAFRGGRCGRRHPARSASCRSSTPVSGAGSG